MKQTLLQALLLFLLLIIFAVADYGFSVQYDNLVTGIEELPLFIFSHDWSLLEELKSDLEDDHLVKGIVLERNVDILDKMITEYDLPAADQILDINLLPNMQQFSLSGVRATNKDFFRIKDELEKRETGLMIITQDEDLEKLLDLKEKVVLIRLLLLIGFSLLLFITALIIFATAIKRDNYYWNVYYRSGGRSGRFKHYFLYSLITSILPLISLWILIFLVEKYLHLSYYLDFKTWLIILAAILLTRLLAWFTTRKD